MKNRVESDERSAALASNMQKTAVSSYRWPVVLMLLGLVIGAGGAAIKHPALVGLTYVKNGLVDLRTLAWVCWLLASALVGSGAVTAVFVAATNRSVEFFLAWRYLRRLRRNARTLWVGLVLLTVAGFAYHVLKSPPKQLIALAAAHASLVRIATWGALGVALLGWYVTLFGVLQLAFSVFTTISIFGVHLGTAALVIVLSVMAGFEQDLQQKILGMRAHAVITQRDGMFSKYREITKRAEVNPLVAAASPYLESEVMITSQTNLEGIVLRGVDPKRLARVTELPRFLREKRGAGRLDNLNHPERLAVIPDVPFRWTESKDSLPQTDTGRQKVKGKPADEPSLKLRDKVPQRAIYPGIVIGAELARNLRLYVGDDVNLVAPLGGMSPMGPIPKSRPFRVAAIFYSGMYEFDTKFAYVLLPQAQRFLGYDDEVTGIEIRAKHAEDAKITAKQLSSDLGNRFQVKDWHQLNQTLFSALKLEKLVMFIVLGFIVLVASFSIVTNLIMVVLSKAKEIAALKAIGSTSQSVLRVFVYAGLYIGVIGMLVGMWHGLAFCSFLSAFGLPLNPEVYYISRLPVRLNPSDLALVATASVALSLVATVYPALRAASLSPVAGLRQDA